MSQGLLPYGVELIADDAAVTGRAGLPLVLKILRALGLPRVIREQVRVRERQSGYTEIEKIEALVLLLAAGGDCLDDIAILQADGRLGRLLGRRFPSADTLRHFLYACHDDRLIAEAKRFGAQGVGIEINPDLIHEANQDAEQAGVAHLVRLVEGDFFIADISQATVVTLYLLPEVNRQLLPKLLADLKPGMRIVSSKYDLGDWAPEKTVPVSRGTVYYWVVPPRARQRD